MSTTTRALDLVRRMTERSWQDTVLDGFALHGWVCFHPYDSRRSVAGYPDLTCVHAGQRRCIFVELKAARGRLTDEQRAVGETLRAAGQEWYAWWPSSWASAERVMRGERL